MSQQPLSEYIEGLPNISGTEDLVAGATAEDVSCERSAGHHEAGYAQAIADKKSLG